MQNTKPPTMGTSHICWRKSPLLKRRRYRTTRDPYQVALLKLLVTGGAGYIGSIVANRLVEAGHETVVLDNLSNGHERALPEGARFVKGDLLDARRLRSVLSEGFDGVLHFAALSEVAESVAQPRRYYRNNTFGTLELLEAMREAGTRRLVFSSTAAVYGQPQEVPVMESATPLPTNPYGGSKLASDRLIGYAAASYGLAAVSLRYFNVAGASGRFGNADPTSARIIPAALHVAARRRDAVQIFGTDYPTRDGTPVRDFVHVEDLSHAHLLALEAAVQGKHIVYNLGNGAGFTVIEVIETARRVTNVPIKAVESPRRPGDPAVIVACNQRIRTELGWEPEKSDLETMVSDAWDWIRFHSHEYSLWTGRD
jgi:UDP-glucose 4-epimerase